MATGSVHRSILTPHHEVVHVPQRKSHGGDGDRFALFEHQLQTVLQVEAHTHAHTLRRSDKAADVCQNLVSKAQRTCGCDSMSRLQEHILPSVEMLIRLLAFCVPTTLTQ